MQKQTNGRKAATVIGGFALFAMTVPLTLTCSATGGSYVGCGESVEHQTTALYPSSDSLFDLLPHASSEIGLETYPDHIFTFWPVKIETANSDVTIIDDMMSNGMNFATVQIPPSALGQSFVEDKLNYLRSKGYKIGLEISAGYYEDQLFEVNNHDNQFLTADCLSQQNCEHWNDPYHALDPSYVGVLWQNTLTYVSDLVSQIDPEVVLYDVEYWHTPSTVESFFSDTLCSCNIISEGITAQEYENQWQQRGNDFFQQVFNINPSIPVYFYNELPAKGLRWLAYSDGTYYNNPNGSFPSTTGTNPSPSLYVLPNLELLEKNIKDLNLQNALPWISFVYSYGVSNFDGGYVFFDKSVSREAGRMLRRVGAKGLVHFPNAKKCEEWYDAANMSIDGYSYCLEHEKEIIAGFEEGLDYREKNKIKNGSFEAYKVKTEAEDWDLQRFVPVFWSFEDTVTGDDDSAEYLNLEQDSHEGVFSWRHSFTGALGKRIIESDVFRIEVGEEGMHQLSVSSRVDTESEDSHIKLFLVPLSGKKSSEPGVPAQLNMIKFGKIVPTTTWQRIVKSARVSSGFWKLRIMLNNASASPVVMYIDDLRLEKVETGIPHLFQHRGRSE